MKHRSLVVFLDGKRLDVEDADMHMAFQPIKVERPGMSEDLTAMPRADTYPGETRFRMSFEGRVVSYTDAAPPQRRHHWLQRLADWIVTP